MTPPPGWAGWAAGWAASAANASAASASAASAGAGGWASWASSVSGAAADLGTRVSAARAALTLPADLDPSGDEARQWVGDELAKGDYRDTRSLFERFMRWLVGKLGDLLDNQGSGGVSLPPLVIALVVVAILAAVAFLLRKIRVEQKTVADRQAVLGDSQLTAEQLRARASSAMADGRWGDAVLDHTRAIAREADDRTLLTEAPSLTAHEVGSQLAVVFPAHVGAVAAAMDLFDAVAYGGREATRADAESVRDTDDALRRARPQLPRTPRRAPGSGQPDGPGAGPPSGQPAESEESLWTTGARP